MISEKFNFDSQGIITINKVKDNKIIESQTIENLIVTNARFIIRDLLKSPTPSDALFRLSVGDMGMTYGEDTSNLPPAQLSNLSLVNSYFIVDAVSTETLIYSGRPAIKLNFSIPQELANDSNPSVYNKLITEIGLVTISNKLFSRKVLPIIKTRDIGLDISWTIII